MPRSRRGDGPPEPASARPPERRQTSSRAHGAAAAAAARPMRPRPSRRWPPPCARSKPRGAARRAPPAAVREGALPDGPRIAAFSASGASASGRARSAARSAERAGGIPRVSQRARGRGAAKAGPALRRPAALRPPRAAVGNRGAPGDGCDMPGTVASRGLSTAARPAAGRSATAGSDPGPAGARAACVTQRLESRCWRARPCPRARPG